MGPRTFVSVIRVKEPTNVVRAITGWGAVNEAIHLDVSIPLPGRRFEAFRSRCTLAVGTQSFDSGHASQRVLRKISSQPTSTMKFLVEL